MKPEDKVLLEQGNKLLKSYNEKVVSKRPFKSALTDEEKIALAKWIEEIQKEAVVKACVNCEKEEQEDREPLRNEGYD